MTPTNNSLIAPLIQSFFTQHLQLHKRVSPQTVACYRDTFRLLFQFIKEQTGREPATFRIADLEAEVVLSFLDHLERQRHNCARSRNIRLAAIRTFFRWVALREPRTNQSHHPCFGHPDQAYREENRPSPYARRDGSVAQSA